MEDDSSRVPDDSDEVDFPSATRIGAALARLRRDRGITGEALGALVEMSQAKISKLERGQMRPNPEDVERIARALDAPAVLLDELVDHSRRLRSSAPRRRGSRRTGMAGQQEYFNEEGGARYVRCYEPVVVPGLLQISEYTRRVANGYFALQSGEGSAEEDWHADTAATVSLRARRQERLYDLDRKFDFVVMEAVLGNRFASPSYMLAQIDRIESASGLKNVTVRVVPNDIELLWPPVVGFTILDDSMVLTETTDATMIRDRQTVAFYRRVYEYFAKKAETDLGEMLARYRAKYVDLARSR